MIGKVDSNEAACITLAASRPGARNSRYDRPPSASAAPPPAKPLYPKGTVALWSNPPGNNGSQFLIFFKDFNPATPQYPIIGSVTTGLETVQEIGKTETVANDAGKKVKPKSDVLITSLTVGEVGATAAPAAPVASASTAS